MKGTFKVYLNGEPIGWVSEPIGFVGDPIDFLGEPIAPKPISALGSFECSMTIETHDVAAWEEFVVQSLTPGIDRTVVMKCRQGGGHHRLIRTLWELLKERQPEHFWAFYLKWRGGCRLPRGMQQKPRKDKHHEKV